MATRKVILQAILSLLGILALLVLLPVNSHAQTVTSASGATGISADNFATGTWTTLTGPSIHETAPGQLSPGAIRLKAPDGFIWDTGGTAPVLTITAPKAQRIFLDSQSRTTSDLVFNISGSSGGSPPNNTHTLTFSNIRIRPAAGTPLRSGEIRNIGSAAPGGTTNYGSVSMVAGADNRIRVETAPNATGTLVSAQNVQAGTSITVYSNVRDQFNNFKRNQSATWSLQNINGGVAITNLSSTSGANVTFTGNLVGSAQIQAASGGLTPVRSGTISVVPSEATTLFISTQPSSTATAGTAFGTQPVIQIRDNYTNVVTSDDFTQVTAARSGGTGTLQGTTTRTAVDGVISFTNLFHNVSNDITIDFSASEFSTVTSNTVTINTAAADSLTFIVQPPNGTRNQALTPGPQVQIVDAFGNTVNQSGTGITMTKVSGSGSISGTLTESTDANGIALFDDLKFNQNDNYIIKATATGLKDSEFSHEFFVAEAGKLTTFVIEAEGGGEISTQTAGTPFNIRITAVDGQGNVLDGNAGRDLFEGKVFIRSTGELIAGGDSTAAFTNGVLASHTVNLSSAGSFTISATDPDDVVTGTSNSFTVNPAAADPDSSLITVEPDTLIADGTSTSIVTVHLRDEFGNNLAGDVPEAISISVFIASGTGSLSTTTGNGDGTYTATLTAPNAVGSAILGASIDGTDITSGNPEVVYTYGNLFTFRVEAAGGGNIGPQTAGISFNLRITALDAYNNVVESFEGIGASVNITSNGTLSSGGGTTSTFTDGVLSSHTVAITSAGTRTITARKTASTETGTSNSFTVNPAAASPSTSIITAAGSFLQNDGIDNTTITVRLKDQFGNNLKAGGDNVTLATTGGSMSGVTDNGDGTYAATLTAGTASVTATITGTVNTQAISDDAQVVITTFNEWQSSGGGNPSSRTAWNNAANWTLGIPTTDQVVIVGTGSTNYPVIRDTDPVIDFLVIEFGANVTLDGSAGVRTLTVNNEISGGGAFFGNEGIINLLGNAYLENFIAGSSTVNFTGSSLQTISGDFTGEVLNIQNDVAVNNYFEAFAAINIEPDNTLTMNPGSQLVAIGDININGALVGNESYFQFGGDINGSNITLTNTSLELNGTSLQQQINGIQNIKSFILNNPMGALVHNDLTVTDTLTILQGLLTIDSGLSFVSNTKVGETANIRMLREIAGEQGWRMLAPPLSSTYADFLDGTVTQGFLNAQLSDTLQSSVLWYDETHPGTDNQRWRAPADANDNLTPGRGLFVYFFGDISGDPRYNNPLPDTLNIQGEEFDGEGTSFTFPVTYTPSADTGWNMMANPFAATIDWDDGNWTKTNMDNVIYIWDPSTNDYLTWNGISGSLGDGLIKPFQAFWVKANGVGPPTLKVDKTSKTTGGTFRGKSHKKPAAIEFLLKADSLSKTTHITLSPDGKTGKDTHDAYRLLPFETDTYLELYTSFPDGTQLAINNLARAFGTEISIPLHVGGYIRGEPLSGEVTLSWPQFSDVPDAWTIILEDLDTGKRINLRKDDFYRFTISGYSQKKPVVNTVQNFQLVWNPGDSKSKEVRQNSARFVIHIDPGADGEGLPREYSLGPNYPNPFGESTTIKFATPLEGRVKILLYDILGRKVKTLVDRNYPAGYHQHPWTPAQLASGVYIYVMQAGGKVFSGKMTFIK